MIRNNCFCNYDEYSHILIFLINFTATQDVFKSNDWLIDKSFEARRTYSISKSEFQWIKSTSSRRELIWHWTVLMIKTYFTSIDINLITSGFVVFCNRKKLTSLYWTFLARLQKWKEKICQFIRQNSDLEI